MCRWLCRFSKSPPPVLEKHFWMIVQLSSRGIEIVVIADEATTERRLQLESRGPYGIKFKATFLAVCRLLVRLCDQVFGQFSPIPPKTCVRGTILNLGKRSLCFDFQSVGRKMDFWSLDEALNPPVRESAKCPQRWSARVSFDT